MDTRLVIYCIVPEPLAADGLVADLRAHFARDDRVQVLIDRRKRERRASARGGLPSRSREEEGEDRRSGSDRRRPVLPRLLEGMPPSLAARAEGVKFVQRMLPVSGGLTGLDVLDVVANVREGNPEAPTELYWRVYERVHSRLCVLLGVPDLADKAAPVAFGRILDALEDPANVDTPFDTVLYEAVDAAFAPEPEVHGDVPEGEDVPPSLAISDPTLDEMVVVKERDPRWFARAMGERDKIMRKAGQHLVVAEHIGSTGVPAIAARPIIDLMIGVERMQEPAELRKALVEMGYERCGDGGTRGRAYYRKRGVLEFDVHVVKYNDQLWRDAIAMREFLRRSPTEAARWAVAKREAARAVGGASLLKYAELRGAAMRDLQGRALQSSQRAA